MALNLGTLFTQIRADYSSLDKAESRARRFSGNVTKSFAKTEKAAKSMLKVGAGMTAAFTAPIALAGKAAVKMSLDFNKSVREVNSLLDESQRDFKGLKNDIRDVSLLLGTDLIENTKAAYQAISASVPRENLVSFLEVAGKSAIAGVSTTEIAVDGLTTVMNAWGESAGSATDIADVMLTTVKRGKTTFGELARSMFQVAGIAPELGVDFKEVSAAVATMTKQGVPTSVAMTQIRQSMVALAKPNDEMFSLLKKSGIQSVKTALAQHGLAGTYDILRKSAAKNNISLEKSVGSVEALNAVLKITGKNAGGFGKDLKAMGNASGSMISAFKEMDKARGLEKLVANLKTLSTFLGDVLLPPLEALGEKINELLVPFTAWLKEMNDSNPVLMQMTVGALALVAALGPLLVAAGGLILVFAPMVAAAGGLAGIFASVLAVVPPVTIAIGALAASAYLIYKNWEPLKKFFFALVNDVVKWFKKWRADNAGVINSMIKAWDELVVSAKSLWAAIAKAVSESIAKAVIWLEKFLEPIGGLQGAWELLKQVTADVFTAIIETVKSGFEFIKTIFGNIEQVLNGGISIWELLGRAIGTAFRVLFETGVKIGEKLVDVITDAWDAIKEIDWAELGSWIIEGIIDGLKSMKDAAWNAAADIAEGIKASIGDVFDFGSPSKEMKKFGAWIAEGLGIGISSKSDLPIAAALKMAQGVDSKIKDSFGDLQMDAALGGGGGGFGFGEENIMQQQAALQKEAEIEKANYANQLETLKEAEQLKLDTIMPYWKLKEELAMQHEQKMEGIQKAKQEASLSTASKFFGGLAALQNSSNKKMQKVGKAAAIIQATIDTYRSANAAYASMVGIPVIGPGLAAAAAGAAIIAGMANVTAIRGAKAMGGQVFSGGAYRVAEQGPEMLSNSDGNFLMTGGKGGKITPFSGLGGGEGGGSTNVNIKVVNNVGASVKVEERGEGKDKDIQIIVDKAEAQIAAGIIRGNGEVSDAIATTFDAERRSA